MKRFHISIAVADFTAAMADYSRRLGVEPCVVEDGRYALWRNDLLNFSISCKPGQASGVVRHIGFEDDAVEVFREEEDTAGITWEYFNQAAQLAEIRDKFPAAVHKD
jgi:catechol 2,3-dioxygenase-like lactoylglutathione lyase family enzyme